MFERVPIPTPFQIGPVNAYLAGRTVVDPGPESEEAWSALLSGFEERGLVPGDLEQVLITHPHPDHFGLANRLRADGAEVFASPPAAAIMGDFRGRFEYERSFFVDFFARNGMARETAKTVTGLPDAYLTYAPNVETDRELDAGATVTVDGTTVAVDSVEGHAPGELLFAYDAGDDRHALVGDNVLADITPNPLLQPPPESDGERPRVLPAYNRSLERLRDEGYDRLLTGHREPVADPAARIGGMLDAHEHRTERVAGLVEEPTTAFEVMEGLFGDLPVTEYFPGMSEAVGHLDVLEGRGAVDRHERGGMVLFEAT